MKYIDLIRGLYDVLRPYEGRELAFGLGMNDSDGEVLKEETRVYCGGDEFLARLSNSVSRRKVKYLLFKDQRGRDSWLPIKTETLGLTRVVDTGTGEVIFGRNKGTRVDMVRKAKKIFS